MIEEIPRVCAEIGKIEDPVTNRDGKADFALLVALTTQGKNSRLRIDEEPKQSTGDGVERRSLVIAPVVSAKNPSQFRNPNSRAGTRASRIFAQGTTEMRQTNTAAYRNPIGQTPLVLEKKSLEIPRRLFHLCDCEAAVACLYTKKGIVVLCESVQPDTGVVMSLHQGKGHLATSIL